MFGECLAECLREMSRSSKEGGKGGEEFLVECGKCKQWISGDGLGLDRKKVKRMNFVCKACVEGERWEKEAKEWKKKARELENRKAWEKEQELEELRREMERKMGEKGTKVRRDDKGVQR